MTPCPETLTGATQQKHLQGPHYGYAHLSRSLSLFLCCTSQGENDSWCAWTGGKATASSLACVILGIWRATSEPKYTVTINMLCPHFLNQEFLTEWGKKGEGLILAVSEAAGKAPSLPQDRNDQWIGKSLSISLDDFIIQSHNKSQALIFSPNLFNNRHGLHFTTQRLGVLLRTLRSAGVSPVLLH